MLVFNLLGNYLNNKISKKIMKNHKAPEPISTAVKLLWVSLLFGTIRAIFEIIYVGTKEGYLFGSAIAIPLIGIIALIIKMISQRRNWARITYLVLFIVGSPGMIIGLLMWLSVNPLPSVLRFGELLLSIMALVLLFKNQSSKWFK